MDGQLYDFTVGKRFVDIASSLEELYFKDFEGKITYVDTSAWHYVSYGLNVEEPADFEWDRIFYQKIKRFVLLYSNFVVTREQIFIAHDNYVQLYSIRRKEFEKHQINFHHSVFAFLKLVDPKTDGNLALALLSNGDIQTISGE